MWKYNLRIVNFSKNVMIRENYKSATANKEQNFSGLGSMTCELRLI